MNATTGRRISRREHISQSITDILTTPIGSRVMRRDYGSNIPDLVDQPMTTENILRLQSATVSAIEEFEPRTRISRVTLQTATSGRAVLCIERTDIGEASSTQQTVSIGAAA